MHPLQLGLQQRDRRALGLDQLLGGGVRGPKVCDQLFVRCHCVVVIDSGHPVAVQACGNCRLVDEHDLVRPKRFERVECLVDAGGSGQPGNPTLVLLHVQTALFDDGDPNVDDVVINDQVPCGVGIGCTCKEAECKGIETVAGMLVGGHLFTFVVSTFATILSTCVLRIVA